MALSPKTSLRIRIDRYISKKKLEIRWAVVLSCGHCTIPFSFNLLPLYSNFTVGYWWLMFKGICMQGRTQDYDKRDGTFHHLAINSNFPARHVPLNYVREREFKVNILRLWWANLVQNVTNTLHANQIPCFMSSNRVKHTPRLISIQGGQWK